MNSLAKYEPWFRHMEKVNAVRTSESFELLVKLRAFRASFSIYHQNHLLLKKELEAFYSSPQILRSNAAKRWRPQRVISTYIHNVVSSGISYKEHVSKANAIPTVTDKLKSDIIENPLFHFIRRFRNYLVHIEPLPLISRKSHWRSESGEAKMLQYESLEKSELMEYLKVESNTGRNHDRMAWQYAQGLGEKINLTEVLYDFHVLISGFHHWMILTYVRHHKASFQSLVTEVSSLHQTAANMKWSQDHPITPFQLRHLNWLIELNERSGE